MSTYLITGKLGSGKTLSTIYKIKEFLNAGKRVATNLDIDITKITKPFSRASIVRLPDFPSADDMIALGYGSDSPDESSFGLIVLDESAVWLNSRSWSDDGRKRFIDWLLHSRKYGWHIYLIVQNAALIDKQIRTSVIEFLVECKRLDRIQIPFISSFLKFFGIKSSMPRLHLAIVSYGVSHLSPVAERWVYRGDSLYSAYDTRQIFSGDVSASYSLVPHYNIAGYKMGFFDMYKRVFYSCLIFGFVLGSLFGAFSFDYYKNYYVSTFSVSKDSFISGYYFDSGGTAYLSFSDGSSFATTDYIKKDGQFLFKIGGSYSGVKK